MEVEASCFKTSSSVVRFFFHGVTTVWIWTIFHQKLNDPLILHSRQCNAEMFRAFLIFQLHFEECLLRHMKSFPSLLFFLSGETKFSLARNFFLSFSWNSRELATLFSWTWTMCEKWIAVKQLQHHRRLFYKITLWNITEFYKNEILNFPTVISNVSSFIVFNF